MATGPCYVCLSEEPGSSGEYETCCGLQFCSKEHLQLHKGPGNMDCLPYRITSNDECGRFLVAARDIEAGELILYEDCIAWGPNHTSDVLCIECLTKVADVSVGCDSCGYPLCPEHLQNHPVHEPECDLIKDKLPKLSELDREENLEAEYQFLSPLRCLLLRNQSPSKWRMIANLMDHRQERMADKDIYIEPYRETVVNKIKLLSGGFQEDEIIEVLGYLDVNSIAVRGADGPYQGRGIYPIASLMNHSCICNTRNIIHGTRLECRATVPIGRGEQITTHYVSPLLPLQLRQEKLSERWFFRCNCERCNSPDDLGAFTSAIKCTCPTGFLLPLSSASEVYRCNTCDKEKPGAEVERIVSSFQPIVQAMQVFQMPGTREQEDLLHQLVQQLHPNHYLALEVRLDLARKMARQDSDDAGLESSEDDLIKKKISLCNDVLGVLNIIYPGRSKFRGLLIHELADARLTLSARKKLESPSTDSQSSEEDFSLELDHVVKLLTEGVSCLQHDRPGSYEHEVKNKMAALLTTCSDLQLLHKIV